MFKVATWNVQIPSSRKRIELIKNQIDKINADVWLLTESSNKLILGEGYDSVSTEKYAHKSSKLWAQIWSRWPIVEEIRTFDDFRTVCAKIQAPFGPIIFYATIIPYHMAGVVYNYGSIKKGYKQWQLHVEDLKKQAFDWQRIMNEHKSIPFVLGGDFNQTLWTESRNYGNKTTKTAWDSALRETSLTCLTTENFEELGFITKHPEKAKSKWTIDHLCLDNNTLNSLKEIEVKAFNYFNENLEIMSDHNGTYVEFEL